MLSVNRLPETIEAIWISCEMEMLNCDKLSKTSRAWRYEKGFENMLLLRLTGERERDGRKEERARF